MSKRLVIVICLALMPALALADNVSTSSVQSSDSAAAQLGPAALSSGSNDSSLNVLQPAGGGALQPTSGASGSNSSTSAASQLQAPASTSQSLQVLGQNADGTAHAMNSGSMSWAWLPVAILVGLLAAGVTYVLQRYPDLRPTRILRD